jgi:uncharacterized membrane protein
MNDHLCGCPSEKHRSSEVNVGETERLASAAAGGFLLAVGLGSSNTWLRLTSLAAGAGLVYRGLSGNCMAYRLASELRGESRQAAEAQIDEAGEESFPASDPPSFTASAASPSQRAER